MGRVAEVVLYSCVCFQPSENSHCSLVCLASSAAGVTVSIRPVGAPLCLPTHPSPSAGPGSLCTQASIWHARR